MAKLIVRRAHATGRDGRLHSMVSGNGMIKNQIFKFRETVALHGRRVEVLELEPVGPLASPWPSIKAFTCRQITLINCELHGRTF